MAQPSTTNSAPPPSTGQRGCSNCGAGNPATARFCAQCGAGLPSLAGGPPGSAAALLDDARQHMLLGHWDEAALAAEAVLALDPDSAEAHHVAARARLKQGMRAGALRHAERAVELDGANAEYQATLAEAMRTGETSTGALTSPVVLASAAALAVIVLILVLAFTGRPKPTPKQIVETPAATGPASPFAQTPGSAVYPRPSRPSGVNYDGPRVPSRGAPPGPRALAGDNPAAARSNNAQAPARTPAGLPPAPVDASALQRFAPPAPAQPAAPAQQAAPAPAARRAVPEIVPPLPAVPRRAATVPPAPQPGGSIFGQSPAGAPSAPPEPAQPSRPAAQSRPTAPVSPQQQYVERDYGGAIQGYQNQIANGNASGAKYQQLGLSYERVGDRQKAAEAYRNAIAAYRAQVQAGQDTEIATRGLRSTQRALNMLQGR